jgi:allantoin racemase
MIQKYGLWDRCASVRAVGATVSAIAKDRDRSLEAFIQEAKIAKEQDSADVICLSGAAMVEMDKKMEQALGIPVIDGVVSAVKLVEAQVAYKLRNNKQHTFPFPDKKGAINITDVLQSVYR